MKSNTFSLRSYAAVGILAGVFAAPTVFADELYRPYLGIGAQVLNLKLHKEYGGPIFNKGVVPGGAVFAGVRLGEFAGVELGYNYFSRNRDRTLGAYDIVPGVGAPPIYGGLSFITYNTSVRMQDVNLAVTGYLPLTNVISTLDQTQLFAALGVSRTSVKMRLKAIDSSAGPSANPIMQRFSQKKTVPIARLGVQQNITDNINVSLFSEWKRLKSFNMKSPDKILELRLKNSVSYGLKLGYIF